MSRTKQKKKKEKKNNIKEGKKKGGGRRGGRNAQSGLKPMRTPDDTARVSRKPTVRSSKMGSKSLAAEYSYEDKNAMAYVGLLNDPFSGRFNGCRVPDLLSWPTSTQVFRDVLSGFTTGGTQMQLVFAPLFVAGSAAPALGFYQTRSTSVGTPYPGTWAAYTGSANYGTAQNFAAYRTVSFGVRIVPTTPALARGGTIRVGRVWSVSSFTTAFSQFALDPNFQALPLNSADADSVQLTWRPGDYETALDFMSPTLGADKGCVAIEITAPVGNDQGWMIEVYHHTEFVPTVSTAPLFQVESVPGNEGAVAAATSWVERAAGAVSGMIQPLLSDQMAAAASTFLEGAITQTTRALGMGMGSVGNNGLMLLERHVKRAESALSRVALSGADTTCHRATLDRLRDMLAQGRRDSADGAPATGGDDEDDFERTSSVSAAVSRRSASQPAKLR